MAKTYEQFKNEVLGKGFDIDGAFSAQCFDGAMYYSQWLGYPVFNCTVTGYVQDIWTQRKKSGILNYYDEVELLQPGDIVVFKKHSSTPLSHIAIFDHDAGNGYGAFLGQNQGAPDMSFNIVNLPYDATYPTAFRPKCFAQSAPIEQESTKAPEKGADGSVYRLYNPNNGDHLYTTNYFEATGVYMSGWDYEGIAWVAPLAGEPVYRVLNPTDGTHAFATVEERDGLEKLGWTAEGVAFYSGGNKPIYRMYNPNSGAHILTADINEHNGLTKLGWTCEGQELKYQHQGRLETKGTKRPKKDVLIHKFVYYSQIHQLNGKNWTI